MASATVVGWLSVLGGPKFDSRHGQTFYLIQQGIYSFRGTGSPIKTLVRLLVDSAWTLLGLLKDSGWTPQGLRLDSGGLCLDSMWTPCGLCLESFWSVGRLPPDSTP